MTIAGRPGVFFDMKGPRVTMPACLPNRLCRFLPVVCLLALLSGPVLAATDFIPLSEIKPGMTGYGLTVFEGTRIDTFGVTVVGVQDRIKVQGSLILVEVSGHGLELSSIAQGMSGSPVFIEGRFAGALAFGWGGALRPLGGITPAEEILALPTGTGHLDQPTPCTGTVGSGVLLETAADTRQLAADLWGEEKVAMATSQNNDAHDWPAPEALLLSLMEKILPSDSGPRPGWLHRPLGFTANSGASAAPATLEAGAACAVPLVTGDAQLGAIGTVTWVDGDDVFMFGHPFMQRGPVHLPLATAEILTIFPSRNLSFKMGQVGEIVGAVTHDQRAGLAGKLGPSPDLIPVKVAVTSPSSARGEAAVTRDYDFAVVSDPQLAPTLVFWSIYNALLAVGDDASRQNVSYELVTRWAGSETVSAEPLVLSGVGTGPGGAMNLAVGMMAPLAILLNNTFAEVTLLEVEAHLTITRPGATAQVVGLSGPREWPADGGPLVFQVELEPRLGEPTFVSLSLDLPPGLKPGIGRVVAASAAELFSLEAQRAPDTFQPASLAATVDLLKTPRSGDELVLALLTPGSGVVVRGQEMDNLPGRVSRLLRGGNMQATPTLADYQARIATETSWLLSGHAVRQLKLTDSGKPVTQERRP